jgi:hypothetical protein
MGCFAIGLVFSIIGFYSLNYLLMGFLLPAVCRYKDIKLFNYWECLALLLFLRNFTSTFQSLDVTCNFNSGSISSAALASQLRPFTKLYQLG